jgi:L-malate glycosyltransferase
LKSVLQARHRLRAILREADVDVLHAHYLTGYGWLARLAGFHPYVLTVWGSDVFVTAKTSRIARAWAWAALRGADLVTADSRELVEATTVLGARRDRTRLIQFGVDTARFIPGQLSPSLRSTLDTDGRRVIFCPRSIAPLYRTLTLIRALPLLPSDCLILLTEKGHEEPYMTQVRNEIERLGVGEQVRMVEGFGHDAMPDVYRLADVVISVPETDGTPVSILEAMSCGRPVVASDLPSVREWLGDLAPWALVAIGDEAATAAAVRRALELTESDRSRLAQGLRETVIARADYARNMLAIEVEYRSLVRQQR